MNRSFISGRLTADPVIRMTEGGKKTANFTLAVQRTKESADFIPCQAWEKTADIAEKYLRKGTLIIVEGRIAVNNYQDQQGNKKVWTCVNVMSIEFGQKHTEAKPEEKEPGYYDGAEDEFAPF